VWIGLPLGIALGASKTSAPPPPGELTDLRHLSTIALAGNNARVEWVNALCLEEGRSFESAICRLQTDGIVTLVEDTDCLRIKIAEAFNCPLTSSMFTRPKLQALYRTLAAAMRIYRDRGAEAEARLGEVFLHAGSDSDAARQFEIAGHLFVDRGALHAGASYYQQAAVLFHGIGLDLQWGRSLYEAAKSLCSEGDWDVAEELCRRIYSRFAKDDRLGVAANICLGFGDCLLEHNERSAEKWYQIVFGNLI
ncbi:MAG: hypothetical protein WD024_04670, partial [Bacillota bacterium]